MQWARDLAASLWGTIAERKRRRWDAAPAGLSEHAGVPTLSIGGLEVGGSGKTPACGWLLAELLAQGRRPGLLTRGYGRSARGLCVRLPGEPMTPARFGDEACMLVASGLDVPVAAVPDRRLGARALVRHGCDVLVLDDGFVHRRLGRDADWVVLSGAWTPEEWHFVPRGRLREGPAALGRAQLLWFHDKGSGHDLAAQQALRDRYAPRVPVVQSSATLADARDVHGMRHRLAGRRLLAAAGIARPDTFFRALEQAGATVAGRLAWPDHAPACRRRWAALGRAAAAAGAEAIVVTAKDWPRWQSRAAAGRWPLWQVPQKLVLAAGAEARMRALLRDALSAKSAV